jgi:hypothetical protein
MSWRALYRKQSDDAASQKYKEALAAAQGATLNAERKLKLALEEAERARADERRLQLSVRERRSADCSCLSLPATRLQLPEPASNQPTFAGATRIGSGNSIPANSRGRAKSRVNLDVKVVRSPEGVLEIEVDKTYNIILGNRGQRELQVGDRVLAVDGVPLGSNSTYLDLAQTLELVLPSKREYIFTVERGGGFGASHVCPVSGLVAGLEDGMIAKTEDAMLAKTTTPLPLAVDKMSAPRTECVEVQLVIDQPLDSITESQHVYMMGLALDVSRALADESVKAQVTSLRSANINSLLPGKIYSYSSLLLSLSLYLSPSTSNSLLRPPAHRHDASPAPLPSAAQNENGVQEEAGVGGGLTVATVRLCQELTNVEASSHLRSNSNEFTSLNLQHACEILSRQALSPSSPVCAQTAYNHVES